MNKIIRALKILPGAYVFAEVIRLFYSLVKYKNINTILFAPPGHFYSPLPSIIQAKKYFETDRNCPTTIPGINLRDEEQLTLLRRFSYFRDDIPFSEDQNKISRYYYSNNYFGAGDSIIAYCMIRNYKPEKIIEIGSGFSSAAMLDTVDSLTGYTTNFTFIEPNAGRLLNLLSEEDRKSCRVIEAAVQSIAPELFSSLSKNDILFIDSSHISKLGSDLNFLLFDILPNLKPGVIIHFHDIIWPFEYPKEWIMQGISWNEAYLLRAFLSFNDSFEILYFNSFIGHCYPDVLEEYFPRCSKHTGGSMWLRKKEDIASSQKQ